MSIVAFESFRTLPVQIGVMGNMVVTVTRDGQIQLGELKAEDIATLRSLSPAWFFVAQALLQYKAAFGAQIHDCPPGTLPAEALDKVLFRIECICGKKLTLIDTQGWKITICSVLEFHCPCGNVLTLPPSSKL